MEKSYKIRTPDGKYIYGMLQGSLSRPLIVLVHGLCGNMNEALHYNAVNFFATKGYSSFRFGLYSYENNARKLHQCTLKTHGADIDTVLAYLQQRGARKIYLVGHSYGLPSILNSKRENVQAIASWDGSVLPHSWFKKLLKVSKPKGYIIDEGYWTIIGAAMRNEAQKMNTEILLKKLITPTLFVTIKGGLNLKKAQKMHQIASVDKRLIIMSKADHCFTLEGNQTRLYAETISWFNRH